MVDYKLCNLKVEIYVVVFVSIYGEGDVLDDVIELYEFLVGKKVLKFVDIKYVVLGLGDSSYEFFC